MRRRRRARAALPEASGREGLKPLGAADHLVRWRGAGCRQQVGDLATGGDRRALHCAGRRRNTICILASPVLSRLGPAPARPAAHVHSQNRALALCALTFITYDMPLMAASCPFQIAGPRDPPHAPIVRHCPPMRAMADASERAMHRWTELPCRL